MTTSRSKAKALSWLGALIALLVLIFGPSFVAREIYGTATPTGEQLRMSRAIVGAVILAPLLLLIGWMRWEGRGAGKAWNSRQESIGFDEPSKQSQKDSC